MTYATLKNTTELMQARGIDIEGIAQLAVENQQAYSPDITLLDAEAALTGILKKRTIQHLIHVGLELDRLTEEGQLDDVLMTMIQGDDGLFGVDEQIGMAIASQYGPIAVTNYGFMDKQKPGEIGKSDREGKETDKTTTFADDIIGSLAAATAAKLANDLKN